MFLTPHPFGEWGEAEDTMSAQPFTQPETKRWFAAWMPKRQVQASVPAPQARTERPAARATTRKAEAPSHPEARTPEDWAGDCLFDWYNR